MNWDRASAGWLARAARIASPNFDARPAGLAIELLVIHYISLPPGQFSGDAIVRLFTNQLDHDAHPALRELTGTRVSAHFLIRRRGQCLQFVSADDRAWHAGASKFGKRDRCNDFSIGIELEGDSEHAFTQAQYRRLAQLTLLLSQRYPLRHVAGHSDIAPGRKEDPGPNFDWSRYMKMLTTTRHSRPF